MQYNRIWGPHPTCSYARAAWRGKSQWELTGRQRGPDNNMSTEPQSSNVGSLTLAIDLGTSRLKLAAFDEELDQAYAVSSSTPTGRARGELEAGDLWLGIQGLVSSAGVGLDLRRITAIGITGMAESGCLIDKQDRPITPMLLWHDRRGIRQAAALRRRAGPRFARLTGLRMTSVRSVAKWRWMIDHGAPRAARWCGAPEWIALCLTGAWATDYTLAVRTGVFDVAGRRYSRELLAAAGARPGIFPPTRGSPAPIGKLRPNVAAELGLSGSAEVVIAGHDDIVSAYGAEGREGDLIDSGGTAEGLVRILASVPSPATTAKARMAMTPFYLTGTFALLAGAGSTGALMQEAAKMLGQSPAELDRLATPRREYPEGTIKARLTKESLPRLKVDSKVAAPRVWSAVLDLVCDRFEAAARRLERLAGPPRRLVLIGGAAQSDELVRRKAERLGLPAVVLHGVDTATLGAAMLAKRSP